MTRDDRYARVLRRLWTDETFCSWSAPAKPSAQFLWFYLLSTPTAGSVPGIFAFSVAATAERFRWPLAGTRKALDEILKSGVAKFDESARLIWLVNALRLNEPENPNVVKSWRRQWHELPECALKEEARIAFEACLLARGKNFFDAFTGNGSGNGSAKKSPNGSGNGSGNGMANQYQEQEQEQEQISPPSPPSRGGSPFGAPKSHDAPSVGKQVW